MTDTLTDIWHDRRVNIGYETAEELAKHAHPLNWRGHPEGQASATNDALDSLGWIDEIKVNVNTGNVFNGHLRISLALAKDPAMRLPVDYYDLSPDEEALALQVLDATTEMAEPIPDKLAALLARTREMTADRPGLGAMLQKLKERAGINGHQKAEDAPPQIDKAAELQKVWGTEVGQIWQLGNHRLAVGDCTDKATVEAVMRGERAESVVTDPPYGIDWDTDYTRFTNGEKRTKVKYEPIHSDNTEFDPRPLLDFDAVVLWGANFYGKYLPIGSWLIWDKRESNGTAWLADAEVAWMKGGYGVYICPHTGPIRENRGMHPTQKRVDVVQWCIEKSNAGDTVFDPFLGSGTTLIACEQLGRRCRGVEIDEGYAAVTIQRWVDLTGQQPKQVA